MMHKSKKWPLWLVLWSRVTIVKWSVPLQRLWRHIPDRHSPVARAGEQRARVRGERADSNGSARRVLQRGHGCARARAPEDGARVRGAGRQIAAAATEAAAVNAVRVRAQRREAQLEEVIAGIHAHGFVSGARGQKTVREHEAVHVVTMVL